MEIRDANGLTMEEFLQKWQPRLIEKPFFTADIIVVRGEKENTEVLLIQRRYHPFAGCWATVGGHVDANEQVEVCAARELEEETHLTDTVMEPVGIFSSPGRDPRGWYISQAYLARQTDLSQKAIGDDDAKNATWFKINSEENDNVITIQLSSADNKIEFKVKRRVEPGVTGNVVKFERVKNDNMAFDHDVILAYSLHQLGIIK